MDALSPRHSQASPGLTGRSVSNTERERSEHESSAQARVAALSLALRQRAAKAARVSAATKLLDRLDHVKATAPDKWLARCPAHEDRSPSLSVRELDGGRLLLHDFGGCQTSDVLAALGLAMSDLFEKPLGQHFAPTHSRIPARDLVAMLDHEITVAVLILNDVVQRRAVNESQVQRLILTAARVGKARDVAKPAKVGSHAA